MCDCSFGKVAFFTCVVTLVFAPRVLGMEGAIGFVTGIRGHCYIQGSGKPLVVGDLVPAGAIVYFGPPKDQGDYIEIALKSDRLISIECSRSSACDQPIALPKLEPEGSMVKRMMRALAHPTRAGVLQPTIARGETEESEHVCEILRNSVKAECLFPDLAPGAYRIRLSPLPTLCTPHAGAPMTYKFSFRSPRDSVELPALSSGVFEIQTSEGSVRWAVLAPPNSYPLARTRFERTKDLTTKWHKYHPDSVHTVLRVELLSLACTDNTFEAN
jgi:hypothetical protein